jgi:protochlorophyllide reductase
MLELHRRGPPKVLSVAAHPGIAAKDLPKSGLIWLHKRLSQHASRGALPTLYAAVGEEVVGGDYIGPRHWFGLGGPPEALTALLFRSLRVPDPKPQRDGNPLKRGRS